MQVLWKVEHPAAVEIRLDGLKTHFRGLPNPHPGRVPRCREASQRVLSRRLATLVNFYVL